MEPASEHRSKMKESGLKPGSGGLKALGLPAVLG